MAMASSKFDEFFVVDLCRIIQLSNQHRLKTAKLVTFAGAGQMRPVFMKAAPVRIGIFGTLLQTSLRTRAPSRRSVRARYDRRHSCVRLFGARADIQRPQQQAGDPPNELEARMLR